MCREQSCRVCSGPLDFVAGLHFRGPKPDKSQKVNCSNFYFELISDRTPGLG
jgi:hypothetical protein